MSEHVGLFALGLVLLAAGAGCLVVGAARLDRAAGRGAFAVGAVAVAFGPCVAGLAFDLAVLMRAPNSLPRLAAGTIVGNTAASIGLVLGLAALVRPVAAAARLFYTAVPLLLGAVVVFWFLARNSPLSRVDAGFLLAAAAAAVVLLVRAARKESDAVKAEFASWVPERTPVWAAALLALAGLAALVGGARLAAKEALDAAIALKSTSLQLSTATALATALPTLVAAVLAARRGRHNVVLGLVVGSAVFNLLLTAGLVAMARPLLIEQRTITDMVPAMALFALLLLPTLANDLTVPRWEGALLLAAYAGFIAWQVFGK